MLVILLAIILITFLLILGVCYFHFGKTGWFEKVKKEYDTIRML